MEHEVTSSEEIAPDISRLRVTAPRVAEKTRPGQFIVLRLEQQGERIPLTVVDSQPESGKITLIVQATGYTTTRLAGLEVGAQIRDILGPLGQPTEIEQFGRVACVGGGVGTALIYPLARAFSEAGNQVVSFIGARSQDLVILEDELREYSDELVVTTEDGSYGRSGFVTGPLSEKISDGQNFDRVHAIGPVPMMQAVAEVTRPAAIKTFASLNPIMVDGTGMCGGCRVTVGEEVKFACMDGPEFDAHQVDFEELKARQDFYHEKEECRLQQLESEERDE